MKGLWRPLGFVTVLVALLMFLMLRSQNPDLGLLRGLQEQLQVFELRDAELTRDTLLVRAGLLPNYDALMRDRANLQAAYAALRRISITGTAPATVALGKPIGVLDGVLDSKLNEVEHFKTNDALLRNSIAYLTYTISRMDVQTGARQATAGEVGELSGTFLRFIQVPNTGTGADFKAALDRIAARREDDDEVRSLIAHGTLVARLLPQVVLQLREIVDAPTTQRVGEVQAQVEQVAGEAEARAQLFRYALFAVSLVLLGFLMRQFARLRAQARARRQLEETAQQQERRLVQANKMAALGTLVSGVAHEINNPNQMVLLNSSVLADTWRDACVQLDVHRERDGDFTLAGLPYAEMREAAATLIRDVNEGARRIDRIVQDLKDFARPQRQGPQKEVDVNDIVNRSARLLAHLVQKKTKRFQLALAAQLPPVRGDAQQIEQVLVNLVVNALEALPDASKAVTVTTQLRASDGWVVVEVADEGDGIAPENLERLCDPFFTTKQDSGGTGLGLSVTFSLVQAHGGRLDFASEPGKGTRVTIAFPPASGAVPAA